jgi:hypothetical protein
LGGSGATGALLGVEGVGGREGGREEVLLFVAGGRMERRWSE